MPTSTFPTLPELDRLQARAAKLDAELADFARRQQQVAGARLAAAGVRSYRGAAVPTSRPPAPVQAAAAPTSTRARPSSTAKRLAADSSSSATAARDDREARLLARALGVSVQEARAIDARMARDAAREVAARYARQPVEHAEQSTARPTHDRAWLDAKMGLPVPRGHRNTESKLYLNAPLTKPSTATRSVYVHSTYTAADPRASHLPPAARRALAERMGVLDADDAGPRYDADAHRLVLGARRNG